MTNGRVSGSIVRTLRERDHMTQAELAQKINVSLSRIKQIETDRENPSAMQLYDLSKVFGCQMEDLIKTQ